MKKYSIAPDAVQNVDACVEELDLSALERLAEAATPGPWIEDGNDVLVGKRLDYIIKCYDINGIADGENNSAFIVASREAVPAICREVRGLRAEVEATATRADEQRDRAKHAEAALEKAQAECAVLRTEVAEQQIVQSHHDGAMRACVSDYNAAQTECAALKDSEDAFYKLWDKHVVVQDALAASQAEVVALREALTVAHAYLDGEAALEKAQAECAALTAERDEWREHVERVVKANDNLYARAETLTYTLTYCQVDQSTERTWCKLCRSEQRWPGNDADRFLHLHMVGCALDRYAPDAAKAVPRG